jgi:hypothetical protein
LTDERELTTEVKSDNLAPANLPQAEVDWLAQILKRLPNKKRKKVLDGQVEYGKD